MGVASSSFPYTLGENVTGAEANRYSSWQLHKAVCKSTKEDVSVFAFNKTNATSQSLDRATQSVMRLKTLRHPHILRFLDSADLSDTIFIVTEYVRPLNITSQGVVVSPDVIALGVFEIASAVAFLNNDCSMAHCNLSPATVFFTISGDWKLGGLDIVGDTSTLRSYDLYTLNCLPSAYRPPEIVKGKVSSFSGAPLHSIDSWLLACFIFELFNGVLDKPQQLTQTARIPPSLLPEYRYLLSTTPHQRLTAQKLLSSTFFKTEIVETITFVDTITLKSDREKSDFFKLLPSRISSFPEECVRYKMLPALINALEFGSASPVVLAAVLTISANISSQEFSKLVLPIIIKLFASTDRAIRAALLKHLPEYEKNLSKKLVNDTLFTNVVTGFSDTEPRIREASLKALIYFIPKLSEKTMQTKGIAVIGHMLNDTVPGIRTNTVIVLGKVANDMSLHIQQKIIIPALTRALRDPFVPSRKAALTAFQATASLYPPTKLARTIIPVIATHCLDPSRDVRAQAITTLRFLIDKVETHANTLPDVATVPLPNEDNVAITSNGPNTKTSNASAAAAMMGSGALVAAAAASGLVGTMSGWAVKSLKKQVMAQNVSTVSAGIMPTSSKHVSSPPSSSYQAPVINTLPALQPNTWQDDDETDNTDFFGDFAVDENADDEDILSGLSLNQHRRNPPTSSSPNFLDDWNMDDLNTSLPPSQSSQTAMTNSWMTSPVNSSETNASFKTSGKSDLKTTKSRSGLSLSDAKRKPAKSGTNRDHFDDDFFQEW